MLRITFYTQQGSAMRKAVALRPENRGHQAPLGAARKGRAQASR